MVVISDTSPISNLIQIGRLELLKELFGEIIIPPFVAVEIDNLSQFGVDLTAYHSAQWITIKSPKNLNFVRELEDDLDKGESEAIAVSREINADLLIIDERLGTKKAQEFGLNTIGLLGCLIQAKQNSIIPLVKPIIEELENIAGFYIGKKLRNRILQLVKE